VHANFGKGAKYNWRLRASLPHVEPPLADLPMAPHRARNSLSGWRQEAAVSDMACVKGAVLALHQAYTAPSKGGNSSTLNSNADLSDETG